jgi:catechol 2,3-dioxygenase-like lactoylglutathione lyase family enzyme
MHVREETYMVAQAAKQLLKSAPYFPVADVQKSADQYTRVFGFRAEYSAGTPPEFAIVSRDGLSIMLKRVDKRERITPSEKQGGTWDAFFWINDAEDLHAELAGKGADVVYGPLVQALYNMKEFAVRDLDGHVLGFGESLTRD